MTEEIIKNITFKGKTKLHVSDVMFKAVFGRHQNVLLKMIRDVFAELSFPLQSISELCWEGRGCRNKVTVVALLVN